MTNEEKNDIIKKAECYNHILLNKHPYFFKYLYKDTKNRFRKYYSSIENLSLHVYGKTLKDLIALENKTDEQQKFVDDYYLKMPVIYSNSTMNVLCRYLEGFKREISQQVAIVDQTDFWTLYQNPDVKYSRESYNKVKKVMLAHLKSKNNGRVAVMYTSEFNNKEADYTYFEEIELLKAEFLMVVNNIDIVVNCLVEFFYKERPKSAKDTLWFAFGDIMFDNVKQNTQGKIYFPIEDENGDILYLGRKFSWREVII